ncbi:porin [Verrucomicrobia bacterium]|nr:porin [Verrucomicrobiota bacterium]
MKHNAKLIGTWIAACVLLISVPLSATADEADKKRIAQLEETVQKLEQQNQKILQILEQMQTKPVATAPAKPVKPSISNMPASTKSHEADHSHTDGKDLRFYWKDGIKIESGDGKFSGKIGGRIQFDTGLHSQDADVTALAGDAPSGAEFRRMRVAFAGELDSGLPTYYKANLEFSGGGVSFKDVYMGIKNVPLLGKIQIGHFYEPFSLEDLTSDNYITFQERSSPVTSLSPGRNSGIMIQNNFLDDDRALFGMGVYTDVGGNGNGSTDGDIRVSARLSGLPWYDEASDGRRYLHLGLSGSAINVQNDAARYRTRPEAHLAPYYLNTGTYASDSSFIGHAEALLTLGSFSLQSEYFHTWSDVEGAPDAAYDAFYVFGSYFLTGEHRSIKKSSGTPNRVKPLRNFGFGSGPGAWELALRYSRTDLNGGLISGGRLSNVSAGVNWHLNPNMRAMVNYIHSDLGRGGLDGSSHLITSRVQFDF